MPKEPMRQRRLGGCIWKGKQQLFVSLQTLGTSKQAEAPHWPCVRMWQGSGGWALVRRWHLDRLLRAGRSGRQPQWSGKASPGELSRGTGRTGTPGLAGEPGVGIPGKAEHCSLPSNPRPQGGDVLRPREALDRGRWACFRPPGTSSSHWLSCREQSQF